MISSHFQLAIALTFLLPLRATPQLGSPLGSTGLEIDPKEQIERLMDELQLTSGLLPNIQLDPTGNDTTLAMADWYGNSRLVVYNDSLLALTRGQELWTVRAVLAHEIGHHVGGHGRVKERTLGQELEADYFAGFLLSRYGSTLPQARAGLRSAIGNATDRLNALDHGWCAGLALDSGRRSSSEASMLRSCSQLPSAPPPMSDRIRLWQGGISSGSPTKGNTKDQIRWQKIGGIYFRQLP